MISVLILHSAFVLQDCENQQLEEKREIKDFIFV